MLGHLQTLVASLFPPPPMPLARERWETPDADFIDVDFAGEAWSAASGADAAPRLVVFHGLEGCSDSHYARAIAAHAAARGWRVALPHFRGCSGEINRLPRAYHSGDSAEVDWVLRKLKADFAVGISLGGNALLKWLGEQGENAPVRRAAAVSAPLDLAAAGNALDRGFNRLVYTAHFLSTLRPKSLAKLERFPGIYDREKVRAARSFRAFDDLVTAPLHGFSGVDDYWTRASCGQWLEFIRVPTLVLNARNDPFLPEENLMAAAQKASSCVLLEFPRTGGHVGFGHRWLAQRLFQYFEP